MAATQTLMPSMPYQLTPLAIVVTLLLTIPGLFVGWIAAQIYWVLMGGYFDDGLFNWISGGWLRVLASAIFPNVLSGMVAGALGVWVSFKVLKKANYEIVAYSVSAIVIAFSAVALAAGFSRTGLHLGLVELASNTGGIVAGLFLAREGFKQEQEKLLGERPDRS